MFRQVDKLAVELRKNLWGDEEGDLPCHSQDMTELLYQIWCAEELSEHKEELARRRAEGVSSCSVPEEAFQSGHLVSKIGFQPDYLVSNTGVDSLPLHLQHVAEKREKKQAEKMQFPDVKGELV